MKRCVVHNETISIVGYGAQVRRILVCTSLVLLLTACGKTSDLAPEQVLQNAAKASQELTSARYTLTAAFTSRAPARTVDMDIGLEGVLQDGGKQTQFTLTFDGAVAEAGRQHKATGVIDIIVAWENDVYLFVRSLSIEPAHPLFSKTAIDRLLGTWWHLPSSNNNDASNVTPDPRLLRTQSEVVRVVKDHGIESMNGRDVHHYDVVVDREKLTLFLKRVANERGEPFDAEETDLFLASLQATGELWIDAENFYVHRLTWSVPATEANGISGELQVDLRDHGTAPPVKPPTDFQQFSPLMLLEDSSFMDQLESQFPTMDELSEEELLPTDTWEDDSMWFEEESLESPDAMTDPEFPL